MNKKYTDSVVQLKENFWNLLLNQGLTGNTFLESYIFGEKTQVKLFDIVFIILSFSIIIAWIFLEEHIILKILL